MEVLLRSLLWVLLLCIVVECSESEELMKIWRVYEDQYTDTTKELEIVESQIIAEKNFKAGYEELIEGMKALRDSFFNIPTGTFTPSASTQESLNIFNAAVKADYERAVAELNQKESELEKACQGEDFWIAIEFIMNESVLTPQPGVPIVDANSLSALQRIEQEILKSLRKHDKNLRNGFIEVNQRINSVENTLKKLKNSDAYNFVLDTVKFRSDSTEISGIIEEFQKNQQIKNKYEEDINAMLNDNEKLKKMDADLNNNEGLWTVRLGTFQVRNPNGTFSNNILSAAVQAAENTKLLREPSKLSDKLNNFYSQFRTSPVLNQFLIHKSLQFLESVYNYLLKKGGKPASMYEEAVEVFKL